MYDKFPNIHNKHKHVKSYIIMSFEGSLKILNMQGDSFPQVGLQYYPQYRTIASIVSVHEHCNCEFLSSEDLKTYFEILTNHYSRLNQIS